MNRASYTDVSTSGGGIGKYPLSTESLDFIQGQIELLEVLAGVGGRNYILCEPDGVNCGVAVVVNAGGRHEVVEIDPVPVFGSSVNYLTLRTEAVDVVADGEVYVGARMLRKGRFTSGRGAESYELNSFANVEGKMLGVFPTNARLAAQIKNMPQTVLGLMRDVLAEKLCYRNVQGMTGEMLDKLRTSCVASCAESISLFGFNNYTLIVTEQGKQYVRQELIAGRDRHYVRIFDGQAWSRWEQNVETAMHIDVKIWGGVVYLRHSTLSDNCEIILLRKKRRSAYRSTGGNNALVKNKGRRQKRMPKTQYVYYKGIKLSKGSPGKWYVPKCVSVANAKQDGALIGKELPSLCASLFYARPDGTWRIQGCRKSMALKDAPGKAGLYHCGFASIGVQIARPGLNNTKDGGGEIVRLKYRVGQKKVKLDSGAYAYRWIKTFSVE